MNRSSCLRANLFRRLSEIRSMLEFILVLSFLGLCHAMSEIIYKLTCKIHSHQLYSIFFAFFDCLNYIVKNLQEPYTLFGNNIHNSYLFY